MRARHRLSKFLLRRELRFPGTEGQLAPAPPALARLAALRRSGLRGHLRRLPVRGARDRPAPPDADRDARAARAREPARRRDRPSALLPRRRHADCRRACAELSDFARFRRPQAALGFSASSPPSTSPASSAARGNHQSRPPHARRLLVEVVPSTAADPPSASSWLAASSTKTRASSRSPVALPAARAQALADAGHRARQGKGVATIALRARAGGVPLRSSRARLTTRPQSPDAAGARTDSRGPGCRTQGSVSPLWVAGKPAAPAARPRPATNKGHEVASLAYQPDSKVDHAGPPPCRPGSAPRRPRPRTRGPTQR